MRHLTLKFTGNLPQLIPLFHSIPTTPSKHKLSAIRFLTNRLHSYHVTGTHKIQEYNMIRHILHANNYRPITLNKVPSRVQATIHDPQSQSHPPLQPVPNKSQSTSQSPKTKKFATSTYTRKETRFVTKLFRHTNLCIAYKTKNTTGKLLHHQYGPGNDDHLQNSGIYQFTCPDWDMKYIRQTGRSFHMRFREHLRDYKYRTGNSKFAQHLQDHNHSFGRIDAVMDVLHVIKKGAMMDTLERYHIHRITNLDTQINDKNTASHNTLFDTLIQHDVPRGHLYLPYKTQPRCSNPIHFGSDQQSGSGKEAPRDIIIQP